MHKKIKLTFGVLGITALIALSSVYHSLKSSPLAQQAAIANATVLPTPDTDMDHDGLPDGEESIWNTDPQNPDTDGDGFKDGEEVVSGHNPTIAGPDDLLFDTQKQNVTGKISKLTLAGLMDGQLSATNPDTVALQALTDETIAQARINLTGPEPILTISPQTTANQTAYFKSLQTVILDIAQKEPASLVPLLQAYQNISDPTQLSSSLVIEIATTQANIIGNHVNQLKQMVVPEKFVTAHKDLIKLLEQSQNAYLALAHTEDDPLQSVVAISLLIDNLITYLPTTISALNPNSTP